MIPVLDQDLRLLRDFSSLIETEGNCFVNSICSSSFARASSMYGRLQHDHWDLTVEHRDEQGQRLGLCHQDSVQGLA